MMVRWVRFTHSVPLQPQVIWHFVSFGHLSLREVEGWAGDGFFGGKSMNLKQLLIQLLRGESGQDIAEYAVMLAVILVIVVGTVQLIGTNANSVFSSVASSIQ
jgi:pilus assembly protein Flp/PilA